MGLPTDEDVLPRALEEALADDDDARAVQLLRVAQTAIEQDERVDVGSMLSQLDAHEWFSEAARLGRLVWSRGPEPSAALPHVYALIGTGHYTEAIAVLQDCDTTGPEARRAVDLALARAYEQLYLDARPSTVEPRAHDLVKALRYYRACFDGRIDHPLWDGPEPPLHEAIGVVALLRHAERRRTGYTSWAPLSAKLREVVLPRVEHDGDPQLVGVAIEACLAADDQVGESLAQLLGRCVGDPRVPLSVLQQTLGRLRRLWELDPAVPREGMVLRRLQQACVLRGGRGPSVEALGEVGERRTARWWFVDASGRQQPGGTVLEAQRSTQPLAGHNLYRLRFRLVTDAVTRLEYLGDDGRWVGTRTYGNLFVNRVTLGPFDDILLELSGRDHRGEDIIVSGWYHMDGVHYTFGPGRPGDSILVEIDTSLIADDSLQIFDFQVSGETSRGRVFSYDPVVLLAPAKGERTKAG